MVLDWRSLKSILWSVFRGVRFDISMPKSILAMGFSFICGILIISLCISNLLGPVGSSYSVEETVKISPGMSNAAISSLLAERGFIRSSYLFRLTSRLRGVSRSLKAGEYALSRDMDMLQILHKIVAGKTILHRFTIPEGFTLSQIARLWEEKGLGSANDFVKVSRDPAIMEKHGIDSDSLEGYLFPDTYMFPRAISEREAIDKMVSQFDKKLYHLKVDGYTENHSAANLSLHKIISLASIIEREAIVEDEKPVISAVFHNRLRRERKLESCATVLYSLGYPRRKLTYRDLRDTQSPYNTYIHKGLPPGPICNPGLGAIAAAFSPTNDRYLYFVARNDGTHYFAETYADFLNAKRKYQGS